MSDPNDERHKQKDETGSHPNYLNHFSASNQPRSHRQRLFLTEADQNAEVPNHNNAPAPLDESERPPAGHHTNNNNNDSNSNINRLTEVLDQLRLLPPELLVQSSAADVSSTIHDQWFKFGEIYEKTPDLDEESWLNRSWKQRTHVIGKLLTAKEIDFYLRFLIKMKALTW